eukprot:Opistho-2@13362
MENGAADREMTSEGSSHVLSAAEVQFDKEVLSELHFLVAAANPRSRLQHVVLIINTALLIGVVAILLAVAFSAKQNLDKMNDTMTLMVAKMDQLYAAVQATNANIGHTSDLTLNIIANTYSMCNVMTLGTEKEKDCRNNIGF